MCKTFIGNNKFLNAKGVTVAIESIQKEKVHRYFSMIFSKFVSSLLAEMKLEAINKIQTTSQAKIIF